MSPRPLPSWMEEEPSAPAQGATPAWMEPEEPAAPGVTSSAGGAALRGFGQGLTANFGDELGAGLQFLLQKAANAAPTGALEGLGISNDFTQDAGDVYRRAREGNRAQLAADMEQQTGASLAGNVAGGAVLSGLAPGSGYAQAAGLGALGGLGESGADLTRPNGQALSQVAGDSLMGAGLGLAGQALGDGIGRVAAPVASRAARAFGDAAEEFAAKRALNAAGYFKNEMKPLVKRGGVAKLVEMGTNLLEEPGVIRAGRGVDDVLEGVEGARSKWGQEVGRILGEADATGATFDMSRVARRVIDDVIKPNQRSPAIRSEVKAIGSQLSEMLAEARRGGLSFAEANRWKSDFANGTINWGNHWNNFGPSHFLEKYQVQLAGIFNDEIEQQLGKQLGPDAFDAFLDAKSRAGTFIDATGKARNLQAGREGNTGVSLKDLGLGAVAGGGIPGFAATLASKLGRERGASVLARGAYGAAQSETLESLVKADPAAFGRFGGALTRAAADSPEALAALHFLLGQTDPDYQRQARQAAGATGTTP